MNETQKAKIIAAQKARWARVKAGKSNLDAATETAALHPAAGFSPEEYSKLAPEQKAQAAKPLVKLANNAPVKVSVTWDSVRYWLNAAKAFEQGKLFSQVMVGFELLALHKAFGISQGKRADLVPHNFPQAEGSETNSGISGASSADNWEAICKREAGISDATGYRYMDMAKAATPRLKQLPELKNFDPFKRSLKSLKPAMQEAVQTAVKKLTDGKTQGEFFDALYKQGGKGTGREPGCDNTRKQLSIAETAALIEQAALERMEDIDKGLRALKADFCNVRRDEPIIAFQASLEQTLNAVKAYLKQPLTDRKPAEILAMFPH